LPQQHARSVLRNLKIPPAPEYTVSHTLWKMAQPNAPAAAGARPAGQPQEQGGMGMMQKLLLGGSMYFGMNMLMNNMFKKT